MPNYNSADPLELIQVARGLTSLQRRIVLALRDRGPGLLLEVAVRVLKFPEEISEAVADLRDKRVVEFARVSGGAFGGDMISLTPLGEQLAIQLRDSAFVEQVEQLSQPRAWELQEQEATLLQRLGDLAVQKGDTAAAKDYYTQALNVTRLLSAANGTP